jgi:hypothetical protein
MPWQANCSATRPGTFQKAHKLAIGSRGQIRRDLTIELISQLDEIFDKRQPSVTKMDRVVSNLVEHAMRGDPAAIKEIFDRVEGRVSQKPIVEPEKEVAVKFKTIEEIKMYLLERGIDAERLPTAAYTY